MTVETLIYGCCFGGCALIVCALIMAALVSYLHPIITKFPVKAMDYAGMETIVPFIDEKRRGNWSLEVQEAFAKYCACGFDQ